MKRLAWRSGFVLVVSLMFLALAAGCDKSDKSPAPPTQGQPPAPGQNTGDNQNVTEGYRDQPARTADSLAALPPDQAPPPPSDIVEIPSEPKLKTADSGPQKFKAPPLQPPPNATTALRQMTPPPAATIDPPSSDTEDGQPAGDTATELIIPRSLPDDAEQAQKAFQDLLPVIESRVMGELRFTDQYQQMLGLARRLKIKSDHVVADIGAGTGFLSLVLMENGIAFHTFYAVDINPYGLRVLEEIIKRKPSLIGGAQVKTIVSQVDDVKLPVGVVDVAVILDSPFYLPENAGEPFAADHPAVKCLASLYRSMKSGSTLHVINSLKQLHLDRFENDKLIPATFAAAGFQSPKKQEYKEGGEMYQHFVFKR
ncbi:MAG: methyltransferase domain-containing protein [Candidatus Lernaella stagnicola]|nr:methyltransferase domain-containing protein [Candidatus Lernaella stagnicola]